MIVNLILLGFFKYFDFFVSSAASGLASLGLDVDLWLLGIACLPGSPVHVPGDELHQSMFIADIWSPRITFRTTCCSCRFSRISSPGRFSRRRGSCRNCSAQRTFDWTRVQSGVFLIGWGLFKKIFIADNLERFVKGTYALGANADDTEVLFATYAFAIQIYSDFSAYSDIARGTSRLLGIEITVNFNVPYIARNPSEFWRRWHISLSSWLRRLSVHSARWQSRPARTHLSEPAH